MLRRTRVLIVDVKLIGLAGKRCGSGGGFGAGVDPNYDQLGWLLSGFGLLPHARHRKRALTMLTLGDAILLRNRMIEVLDLADNHLTRPSAKPF
jgi:hypothetical protein